jgi:hypothetical protein
MNQRRQAVPGHRGIYRSSSGNYEIGYRASDTNRLIHHVCDNVCGTNLAAADRANAEIRTLRGRGLLLDCSTPFASAADQWHSHQIDRVAASAVAADTLRRYEQALALLTPLLDPPAHRGQPGRHRLLRDIFPHTIAGLTERLAEQGVSPASRDVALSVLRNLLEHTVAAGELGYNAVDEYRTAARHRAGSG